MRSCFVSVLGSMTGSAAGSSSRDHSSRENSGPPPPGQQAVAYSELQKGWWKEIFVQTNENVECSHSARPVRDGESPATVCDVKFEMEGSVVRLEGPQNGAVEDLARSLFGMAMS